MNKIHKRRLYYLGFFALGLTVAAGLVLYALKQNINVFLTPEQLHHAHPSPGYHFRLGGMVKQGSVVRKNDTLNVEFIVTDFKQEQRVHYAGILPDLFREGTGVIAEGSLNNHGTMIASQVLAKHDENYMPDKTYRLMKRQQTIPTIPKENS